MAVFRPITVVTQHLRLLSDVTDLLSQPLFDQFIWGTDCVRGAPKLHSFVAYEELLGKLASYRTIRRWCDGL